MVEATAYDLVGQVLHSSAPHDGAVDAWLKALALLAEITGTGQQAGSIRLKLSDLTTGLAIEAPAQTRPLSQDSTVRPGTSCSSELTSRPE